MSSLIVYFSQISVHVGYIYLLTNLDLLEPSLSTRNIPIPYITFNPIKLNKVRELLPKRAPFHCEVSF